jgi:hypothetical protein
MEGKRKVLAAVPKVQIQRIFKPGLFSLRGMMNEVQTMICTVERKRFSKVIYFPLVLGTLKIQL